MILHEIDRAAMQEACRLAGTDDVSVWTLEEPNGKLVGIHKHSCAQLTTAYGGSITIHTADNSWTVSAGQCLWLPENTDHEIEIRRATRLQIAYIRRRNTDGHPESCCPILTSRLLHELFATAVHAGEAAWKDARMKRVFGLMLDEIRLAPSVAKHMLALQYLAQGLSVSAAADKLGYANTKALDAVFTRLLGQPPQTCMPLHQTKSATRPGP
jgi:mannose-6-phosphate isomerase-like protein (cupin superfamily)